MLFCSPILSMALCWPFTVHQHAPQPKPGGAALFEAELDQAAGALEDLGGKFSAVFAGHGAFDAFDDGGHRAAVVFKLLRAVVDGDAGLAAYVFIIGALVGILEPPPAADIVHQDAGELHRAALDILDHLGERVAALDVQAAFALVGILFDDLHARGAWRTPG